MNPADNDFFLVLTSNASTHLYQHNKPHAFTTVIDQAFKLDGTWDVALWSITLPTSVMMPDPEHPGEADPVKSMLVYTDIVTDTVIAGHSYPLLALVPVFGKRGMFVPTHLAYHRVRQNLELKDISIKLQDISGAAAELQDPDSVVIVELHLKRRSI